MQSRLLFIRSFAVLGVLIGMTTADAAPLVVNFTGTVTNNDGLSAFSAGDTLTGSYVFESTTPPRGTSNSDFAVFDAVQSLQFQIGSYSASSDPNNGEEIQIDNAPGITMMPPQNDRYGVTVRRSGGLVGPDVDFLELEGFSFRLDDTSNTVFSDALDPLPTSLNIADFDATNFFLFFTSDEPTATVVGTIDSIQVVPEPTSLLIWSAGAIGFVGVRRFRRRRLGSTR